MDILIGGLIVALGIHDLSGAKKAAAEYEQSLSIRLVPVIITIALGLATVFGMFPPIGSR